MLERIIKLSRLKKRIVSLVVDTFFLVIAFFGAFIARHDNLLALNQTDNFLILAFVLPASLYAFAKLGLYRAVLRYMNFKALWSVLFGCLISLSIFIAVAFVLNVQIPRTVPFLFACFSLLLIGGSRILIRSLIGAHNWQKKDSVIIYGAGSAGRQLATALSHGAEYHVAAFIDDDPQKQRNTIQGIKVYSTLELKALTARLNAKSILLALPSTSRTRRKEILNHLEYLPLKVLTIPGMVDIVSGNATVSEYKDVDIEDLLGRDCVAPNERLMSSDISDKVVMVTGAGGSIGSELCRQILRQQPNKLVLFELSEFGLYQIDKELQELKNTLGVTCEIYPVMGTVQAKERVETVMTSFQVDTVYHAAAYKHVPLVEHNVVEGVRNNIFGTYYTAQAAINSGVSTFVLISTDKAVRPTNIMGTTKRMAELVLQALSTTQNTTRCCMVRFGNVLGSSGSVVPLFRKQIKEGGPITLTHKDITRFFMTIPEAAQLVIQAGAMGKGGDVFVLDMGDPVKIKDLAEKMVRLSGLTVKSDNNSKGDIEILCTGLRPGEKLYEELLIGDNVSGTFHERIMTAKEIMLPWPELNSVLNELDVACHEFDNNKIRKILLDTPTGFSPTDGICDLVWLQNQAKKSSVHKSKVSQLIS